MPVMDGLARLLDDDPITAYWVGFLMSDASFSTWRMKVALSSKDESHARQLAEWLDPSIRVGFQRNGSIVSFSQQDRVIVPAIRERFDIRPRKTYNPPERLPYEDKILLRCWLVGHIDADGEVRCQTGRRAATLHTVSHLSWEPFFLSLSDRLAFGTVRRRTVRGTEYAALRSHRHGEIVEILRFAQSHALPIMDRKWSNVDVDYVAKAQTGSGALIARLLMEGWRGIDISREYGYPKAYISNIRRQILSLPDARYTVNKEDV